jgi:acyl-CoA synthetase (AMP-forming)/AMP-acid ligase II
MHGLMMDEPLILSQLFERSRQVFAKKTLATRVPGQPLFRYTYADFAGRVERLAGGLVALGMQPGDRVGTFAWNTYHHLEAYWAVPMMGSVLHTINFRLSSQDISYIINHAGDAILLVGASVWPLLEPIRAELTTVKQIVIIRDTPAAVVPEGLLEYEDLLNLGELVSTWPTSTSGRLRACATRRAPPATRRASSTRTGRSICTRSPAPRWTSSASARATRSSTSSRCSTPTAGACRTPPSWSARPRSSRGRARSRATSWT